MRERLAEKLLRMPMGTIIETGPGELKKSFLENVEDMELILAHALPEGLANLLSFLVVTGALFVVELAYGTALSGSLAYRMYCVLGNAADQ